MRCSSPVLFLGVLLQTFVDAKTFVSPYVVHEKRDVVPDGWTTIGRHDSESILPVRFGLMQSNLHAIEDYLLDVSHPKSPNYGKHWSVEKVASTFAPSDDSLAAVREWLLENGIDVENVKVSPSKGWVEVSMTVAEAEDLLKTEYHLYEHVSGAKYPGCTAYHLPAHIKPHVDFVTPTVHFAVKKGSSDNLVKRHLVPQSEPAATRDVHNGIAGEILARSSAEPKLPEQLENCSTTITPACLRALYNLSYLPVAADKNSYGIVEYTPTGYLQSDLDNFFREYEPYMVGSEPIFVSIDGGYDAEEPSYNLEGDLDLEFAMALVTGKQNVTYYQVGDYVEKNGTMADVAFDDFLDAIDGSYCTFDGGNPTDDPVYPDPYPGGYNGTLNCGTVTPTYVISTSYEDDEFTIPPQYLARQCAEYAKLGLMGLTILYSSGDSGVGGGCKLTGHFGFTPGFPATCPYITAVGATMMEPNSTIYDPEVGANVPALEFSSSGGFSNYFAIPSWQTDAVNYYLTNYPPDLPPNTWNSSGSRAYPDLSANGANYNVSINGVSVYTFGTSCASPVVGALLTMINDARLALGKSTIGFINPTIYSPEFAGAFNDITSGNNPGCNTTGFYAEKGWDPVTGLGTPNFGKLLELWTELQ